MTYTVLRWQDDYVGVPLEEQLRSRPGRWAVVADNAPSSTAALHRDKVRGLLGDGFEVDCDPVSDGPYGIIYEITARFVPVYERGG